MLASLPTEDDECNTTMADTQHHPATLEEVNNELTLVRTLTPLQRTADDDELIDTLEAKKRELQAGAAGPAGEPAPAAPAAGPAAPAMDPPPDGGLTAWLVVAGGFLLMFSVFGFGESRGTMTVLMGD